MTIQEALSNPCISDAAKATLTAALNRDAVDAYYDAKLVADLLKVRMDAASR